MASYLSGDGPGSFLAGFVSENNPRRLMPRTMLPVWAGYGVNLETIDRSDGRA
jgi:hypothetical protein